MGVFVPFMEMPKSCAECPLMESDLFETCSCGIFTCYDGGDVTNKDYEPFDFVPDWCSLREVPTPEGAGSLSRDKNFELVERR